MPHPRPPPPPPPPLPGARYQPRVGAQHDDTILVHLKAAPATIRARMAGAPHEHPAVPDTDVEAVQVGARAS